MAYLGRWDQKDEGRDWKDKGEEGIEISLLVSENMCPHGV